MASSSPAPLLEIGETGLMRQYGTVEQDPLREMRGSNGRKLLVEMSENDPVIGALLFSIDMLIRQVEWKVTPQEKDDPKQEEAAQFVDSCLKDLTIPFKEVVSEILSMLVFGWSFHEIVFKMRQGPFGESPSRFSDNRLGWERFAPRSQQTLVRWIFEPNGDVLGLVQSKREPLFEEVTIPISKGLLFRTNSRNNNPEGRSIIRNAYRPWYIKKNLENIQAIGIERDLAGLPVAYLPPEYFSPDAPADKVALLESVKKLLRNIRRDEQEGIVIPRMYDDDHNLVFDLVLLGQGGRRQFDTKGIIQYYDSRMAMVAMADFILLGHEIHGSFALASSKTEMLVHALGSYMGVIRDQFNRKAIPQLLLLNGFDIEDTPHLTHTDIETLDLSKLGTYIQQIAGAEVLTKDAELESFLREHAGLPEKSTAV